MNKINLNERVQLNIPYSQHRDAMKIRDDVIGMNRNPNRKYKDTVLKPVYDGKKFLYWETRRRYLEHFLKWYDDGEQNKSEPVVIHQEKYKEEISTWKKDFPDMTLAELKKITRCMINSSVLNTPLPLNTQDHLLKIICHHSSFQEKRGDGIKHLEIRERCDVGSYITRCVYIVHFDNSSVDISWCLSLEPESLTQIVNRVARYEINDQIEKFKEDSKQISKCGICHESIVGKETHIDHIYPFKKLWSDFMSLKGKSYSDFTIVYKEDDTKRFEDCALAEEWKEYHLTIKPNNLRKVHKGCNLKRKIN